MPTYEYVCDRCDHRFEKIQSITAASLKRCPRCGSRIRRVIHGGAGLVFKGSGFYSTDYRGGGSTRPSKSSAETTPCEGTNSPACKTCPKREK
jgi:putative FmdB family regulatory protein